MVTIEKDPEELEYLETRKRWLLAQAKILCDAYDAGTLKQILAQLKTGEDKIEVNNDESN